MDHLTEQINRLKALLRLTIDPLTRAAIANELAVLQTCLIARSSAA
jgi:hypothetical protein